MQSQTEESRKGRLLRLASLPILAFLASSGCRPTPTLGPSVGLVERSHNAMGTQIQVSVWTDDAAVSTAVDAVFAEFDRLERLMSVWIPDSDISRLNAAAGNHPVPISPDVQEALAIAHDVSEWTDGAFDVTFGALSGFWKFDDQNRDNTVPDPSAVRPRLTLVNYRDLVLSRGAGTAFLTRTGMNANLGGIGKGYAVDRAVEMLRRRGFRDFMIQAGGDMYVAGRRGDRPWRVGIRDPRGPRDKTFAAMDLTDATFSTSGDYEHFFFKDGRRYHHILDLKVGAPAQGCRSVTLVTARAVIADALAKGVFVLGPRAGLSLIERIPDVEGVIVSARNEVLMSSGLRDRLMILSTPTDAP